MTLEKELLNPCEVGTGIKEIMSSKEKLEEEKLSGNEREIFELLENFKNPELVEKNFNRLKELIKSPEMKEILEKPIFEAKEGDLLFSFENGARILFRKETQEKIKEIEKSSVDKEGRWTGEYHAFGMGKEKGDNFLVEKIILPEPKETKVGFTNWDSSKKYEDRVKSEADKDNLKVICHFHTHLKSDWRRSGGDENRWERMGYKFNMRLASILIPQDKKESFFFAVKNENPQNTEGEVQEGEKEKYRDIFYFPREPREDLKGEFNQREKIEEELKPKEIAKDRVNSILKKEKEEAEGIENRIHRLKQAIPLREEVKRIVEEVKQEKRKFTKSEFEKYKKLLAIVGEGDPFVSLTPKIELLEIERKLKEEEIEKINKVQTELQEIV